MALLIKEVNHLAVFNYSSEHVLVFSSVILQCDKVVRKGTDIHCLLDRHIQLWQEEKFDLLLQEVLAVT